MKNRTTEPEILDFTKPDVAFRFWVNYWRNMLKLPFKLMKDEQERLGIRQP